MSVNLLPGYGFVQESGTGNNLLPGYGFVREAQEALNRGAAFLLKMISF